MERRQFLRTAAAAALTGSLGGLGPVGLAGCRNSSRYSEDDERDLEQQRLREAAASGQGPDGPQHYEGYRGIAKLPWFEWDAQRGLRCVDESVPLAVDIHAHLAMWFLFAPAVDLQATTPRVRHMLDCDGEEPVCPVDLDVYMNANFRERDLRSLYWDSAARLLWGSGSAETHTVPNLLAEMDATRIGQAVLLPIEFGLLFRDDLTNQWMRAVDDAGAGDRLIKGASVFPGDADAVTKLEDYARRGARIVKLHPAGQRFFPDDPEAMVIYEACERLGLPVFFHGGRAGIEPEYSHQFTLMRHYEGAFREFPKLPFVLGHAGARDVAEAIPVAKRYPNVWMGTHGQGVTSLRGLIEQVGAERLLFGTDWPFYHQCTSLAKVLLVTEGDAGLRRAILRDNAARLLPQV